MGWGSGFLLGQPEWADVLDGQLLDALQEKAAQQEKPGNSLTKGSPTALLEFRLLNEQRFSYFFSLIFFHNFQSH